MKEDVSMPKKQKDEKIAVVIDGKDICRIIPFKPSDGKYEIKIDFLGNEFNTSCYRLFSHRPIQWEIYDSKDLEVTYHKGENTKPLVIHLKNKDKINGQPLYTNLPLKRIQAPNVNQLFPIPILKLEIPSGAASKNYKPRGYHKVIDPDDCNVVEIYMAHVDFDMESFANKLPGMHISFLLLSFEIFATNTVMTDYQKGENIIPKGKPKNIMTSFNMFDDMKIYAIHFKDKHLDEKTSKINVTFIENELSEAILCMMKIVYPETSNNGVYDNIYLGGASLRDVNQPVAPLVRPSIGTNNVISDAFQRNKLIEEEKEHLYWYALKLRLQLRDAFIEHHKRTDQLKIELTNKVSRFLKALNKIKDGQERIDLADDEKGWFTSYPKKQSVFISLMVAKYLGMDQCLLYARTIGGLGGEQEIFHAWLLYYDIFDIDSTYSSLRDYTTLELQDIMVAPAENHPLLSEYASFRHTIEEKGYTRGQLQQGVYQSKKFNDYFKQNNSLLNRIYEKALSVLNASEM
jgi:hypothetical protein